jgi:hypothetical protein
MVDTGAFDLVPGSMSFAFVQHAETRSRAAIRTLPVTMAAEDSAVAPQSAKRPRAQPVHVAPPAGQMLVLTLTDPLIVYIPTTSPPREAVAGSRP